MDTTKEDYEKLAAFRYALRRFLRFSEQAALSTGLTPQQHQALLAIEGFPGRDWISISELAERLQLEHHSVVGLVHRLVKAGLLARKSTNADKRLVLIAISPRARTLLGKVSVVHKRRLHEFGPELARTLQELNQSSSNHDHE
jgi:DNA-binding MarR family transcriptional regulator